MKGYRLACLAVVLLVLAGCKKSEKKIPIEPGDLEPNAVVAKVDGVSLTFADMNGRAMGYLNYAKEHEGLFFAPNLLDDAKMAYRKRAINTFVYKALMLNEAARLGITVSEKEHTANLQKQAQVLLQKGSSTNAYFNNGPLPPEMMRRDFDDFLVIEKMLNKEVQQKIKVMDADVEKGVAEIEATNAVRRATLEAARKQILGGAAFEDVARTVSQDTNSAKRGGDLGEFARGRMDADFEDAAFALPLNQVSEIVESKFGYHLIKVTARNPAQAAKNDAPAVPETIHAAHILIRTLPIDRSKIAATVYRDKFAEGSRKLYEELKAKANIECPLYPDIVLTPVR